MGLGDAIISIIICLIALYFAVLSVICLHYIYIKYLPRVDRSLYINIKYLSRVHHECKLPENVDKYFNIPMSCVRSSFVLSAIIFLRFLTTRTRAVLM